MTRAGMAFLVLAGMALAQETADTVYHNGRIVTMWEARPQAEALAIRGNRFLAVGTNAQVLARAGPATRRVDLRGRTVVPGLIDSHTHPIGAALSEKDGPVPVMNSIPEVLAYIRRQATALAAERIIFVPKIYSTRLKERRYPTRWELDQAAPGRLAMTDNGYASVLNSALLAKLGIARGAPEPANGKIIRDEHGEPTGLILGAGQLLGALRASRPDTHADRIRALRGMQRKYNEVGITSTIDRGQRAEGFRIYQELQRAGELTVRSYVTFSIGAQGTPQQVREEIQRIPFVTGWGDDWVRVGSLKTVIDGGILIGTAYLREPYGMETAIYGYKDPDYRGVLSVPRENVFAMAREAVELGWQMTSHTTGGGATDLLLEAYEEANKVKPIRERRFTVTHGNFPNEAAIARAKRLGVVFDVQPAWHHLDGPALQPVFGPARMGHFLPLRAMFDAGIVVAGGSDHMIRFDPRNAINPFDPFFGMWMAITRQTADGSVLEPAQRINRQEALRMWTLNAAYLSFDEKVKGSIEPGKLADFAVISNDYLNCAVAEIREIETLLTVVDGKAVFER